MVRNFIISIIFVFTSLSSFANEYSASTDAFGPVTYADDRWVPWPWTLAKPFPWADIQGLWKVENGSWSTYFAFKVVREKTTGMKQLFVKQYNADTCQTIATGVGVEKNQKVLAQMTSKAGTVFRVHLTAFDQKDSPLPPLKGNLPVQSVMVLSINALDEEGADIMMHMRIMKVSMLVGQRDCINDVKSK